MPVVLNQHLHTSFIIKDGDQSLAFKDLVTEYLHPAMLSIARGIDQILSSQVYQFLPNVAGHLNSISGTTAQEALLGTRQVMNVNKAYVQNRNLVLGTVSETALLSDKDFTQAFAVGDQGTALREANLGTQVRVRHLHGPEPAVHQPGSDRPGQRRREQRARLRGSASRASPSTGSRRPSRSARGSRSRVTTPRSRSPRRPAGPPRPSITTSQALKTAVVDDAVVTVWGVGAVNLSGGYATGYAKPIVYDTFTQDPQVGQGVTFNTSTILYGVIQVDTIGKTILLDRPLEEVNGIANNDAINLLPSGSYNLGFHRNALTLVTRPLALPMPGTGARAGVANFGGLSMRVTMTYDGNKQGTLVTLDTLLGVKVLDQKLGAILLG